MNNPPGYKISIRENREAIRKMQKQNRRHRQQQLSPPEPGLLEEDVRTQRVRRFAPGTEADQFVFEGEEEPSGVWEWCGWCPSRRT